MTDQQLIDEGYKEGKKSLDYFKQKVLKGFDFEKVRRVMLALDWNWALGKDENDFDRKGIPDIDTIARKAISLIEISYNESGSISSAGFTVGWEGNEMYVVFNAVEFVTSDI